ncbi:MAG TPA: hypothetical protein VMY37_04555 [Thermoguttaceae bacterium]|nr:hypothetical protein [Thermoguttaceae bacterium]
MPEPITIRTRRTRAEVKAELRRLPALLAGRMYDSRGLATTFCAHFAYHIFDKISRSFFAKSLWGSDELGDKWAPLKEATIVARESRREPRRGKRGLSEQHDRLWRRVFAHNFARLAFQIGEREAGARAARMAWATVKAAGARTRKERFRGRRPPMNWISGRLKKSLAPGRRSAAGYLPSPEQRYEQYHGTLVLGTDVPYAPYVHKRRRLWPKRARMLPWIREGVSQGIQAVVRQLQRE